MTGTPGQQMMPAPCPRCTGLGDAHYLTCPTLRLRISPARDRAWREMVALGEELTLLEASDVMNRRLADAAEEGLSVREAVAAWSRGEGDVPP